MIMVPKAQPHADPKANGSSRSKKAFRVYLLIVTYYDLLILFFATAVGDGTIH